MVILFGVPLSLLSPDYMHNSGRIWARVLLWIAGVRLKVEGLENLPKPGNPVIFMGNHQSNFDIPCFLVGLPFQFRWIGKAELFRIPLFGLALRRCGYIPIERGNGRKAMKSLTLAAEMIRSGTSVVIFPEGTRSVDGQMQDFKKGGFIIALKAQVPIVPVAITGSNKVMSKGKFYLSPGTVCLKILPAFETAGLTNRDSRDLVIRVHDCLVEAIEEECK